VPVRAAAFGVASHKHRSDGVISVFEIRGLANSAAEPSEELPLETQKEKNAPKSKENVGIAFCFPDSYSSTQSGNTAGSSILMASAIRPAGRINIVLPNITGGGVRVPRAPRYAGKNFCFFVSVPLPRGDTRSAS